MPHALPPVGASRRDVDGVLQPLAGTDEAHVVTRPGVARVAISTPPRVGTDRLGWRPPEVVGDAFTALSKFGLDDRRYREGAAEVWRLCIRRRLNLVE